jgi:hypothetical protein
MRAQINAGHIPNPRSRTKTPITSADKPKVDPTDKSN